MDLRHSHSRRLAPTLVLLAMVCGASVRSAVADGLSLAQPKLEIEGEKLPPEARFARIDSLETLYHASEGERRGRYAFRLGQLYLATDMTKHRPYAMELLEEATRLLPDGYEAGRLRTVALQRMQFLADARGWMRRFAEERPTDPRPSLLLGRSYFLEARRRMQESAFLEALDAFRRAAQVDSTNVEAWYGIAACVLALGRPEAGLRAVDVLGRLDPGRTETLFLEGAVAFRTGDVDRAHLVWSEALSRCEPELREVFERAEGFLEGRDLATIAERVIDRPTAQAALVRLGEEERPGEEIDWSKALQDSLVRARTLTAFWSGLDVRPTQTYNVRELEYWARLVEADVIFGDPDAGVRGWERPTGATYVRYGRPTSTFYDRGLPGMGGSILDELDNAGVRLRPGESVPRGVPLWVWTYRNDAVWFSLLFTDASFNSLWGFGESSARSAALYRAQQPLLFPPVADEPSPFRLSVSRLLFPRGDDSSVLETVIGLRPSDGFVMDATAIGDEAAPGAGPDPVVQWALYDERGVRIDYREETLGDRNRRSWLHGAVGWSPGESVLDPYVLPIGARLDAGNYRLAVEAWGPGRRGHDAIVIDVVVPPSEPPTLLELSDLQLASAFAPYDPDSGISSRYVKFGQTIVPVADLRIESAAARMGVYFEVRNLALDASGLTSFDVRYEVFASSREIRNLTLSEGFEREDLARIDPLTLTFVEERTGQSAEGLVVKGVQLDVHELKVGDYVLVVTVHDRISDREASRALPFRKRG